MYKCMCVVWVYKHTYFCICSIFIFTCSCVNENVMASLYIHIILQLSGTFGDTNLGNFNSDTECLLGNDHSLQRPARFVLKAVSSSRYVLYYNFLKKYSLE